MTSEYTGLLALHLICLLIRTAYESLKKADKIDPKNSRLFVFIFATMGLLWISWFAMCLIEPIATELPAAVRWLGFAAVIFGWGLGIGAVVQLRGLENIDHLVTSGLYSKLRHPLYTGFLLWIFGWSLFCSAILSLAAGLLTVGSLLYWRHLEENALESRYGDVYRDYRANTWF